MGQGKKDERKCEGEAAGGPTLPPRETPARPAPAPDSDRH
jgi:hypothetical protein